MVALAGGELHVLASSAERDAWLAVRMAGFFVLVPVGALLVVIGLLASEQTGFRPQLWKVSCGWLMIGGAVVLLVGKPIAALWYMFGSAAFVVICGLILVPAGLVNLDVAASEGPSSHRRLLVRCLLVTALIGYGAAMFFIPIALIAIGKALH